MDDHFSESYGDLGDFTSNSSGNGITSPKKPTSEGLVNRKRMDLQALDEKIIEI